MPRYPPSTVPSLRKSAVGRPPNPPPAPWTQIRKPPLPPAPAPLSRLAEPAERQVEPALRNQFRRGRGRREGIRVSFRRRHPWLQARGAAGRHRAGVHRLDSARGSGRRRRRRTLIGPDARPRYGFRFRHHEFVEQKSVADAAPLYQSEMMIPLTQPHDYLIHFGFAGPAAAAALLRARRWDSRHRRGGSNATAPTARGRLRPAGSREPV